MNLNVFPNFLGISYIGGWSGKVFLYNELPSTNIHMTEAIKHDFCFDRSLPRLSEYDIVWTHHQTLGRGRNGNVWLAPSNHESKDNKALTFSLLVVLDKDDQCLFSHQLFNQKKQKKQKEQKTSHLTEFLQHGSSISNLVAWCWSEVFTDFGLQTVLKWPNDILFQGDKLAGILTESLVIDGSLCLVVGMGVNLFLSKEFLARIDQPATALNKCLENTNKKPITIDDIDSTEILTKFLNKFVITTSLWKQQGFSPFVKSWKQKTDLIGRTVHLNFAHKKFGIVEDIDQDGLVLVRPISVLTNKSTNDDTNKIKKTTMSKQSIKVSFADIIV